METSRHFPVQPRQKCRRRESPTCCWMFLSQHLRSYKSEINFQFPCWTIHTTHLNGIVSRRGRINSELDVRCCHGLFCLEFSQHNVGYITYSVIVYCVVSCVHTWNCIGSSSSSSSSLLAWSLFTGILNTNHGLQPGYSYRTKQFG